MSGDDRLDLDRVHALMMGALDEESTPAERAALDEALERFPELAAEYERLRRVKEVTTAMRVRQPPEEIWDRFRVSPVHRIERSVAWTLLLAGLAVLAAWWLWHAIPAFLGSDMPLLLKSAIAASCIGGVMLLASVIRERWVLWRRDPYSKEVIR